jgi:hypothetical protein
MMDKLTINVIKINCQNKLFNIFSNESAVGPRGKLGVGVPTRLPPHFCSPLSPRKKPAVAKLQALKFGGDRWI